MMLLSFFKNNLPKIVSRQFLFCFFCCKKINTFEIICNLSSYRHDCCYLLPISYLHIHTSFFLVKINNIKKDLKFYGRKIKSDIRD